MELTKVIHERYSVRNYLDKQIEEDVLQKILAAGQVAPTAKNNQPQKIYVLKSEQAMQKINTLTKCVYGAPLVLMCCYDKNLSWKNNFTNEDAGVQDVSICVTQMMLEAYNNNVGSCWVNLYDSNELKKAFNLDDNIVVVCLLTLGYIADDAKPNPRHFENKAKEEIFIEL